MDRTYSGALAIWLRRFGRERRHASTSGLNRVRSELSHSNLALRYFEVTYNRSIWHEPRCPCIPRTCPPLEVTSFICRIVLRYAYRWGFFPTRRFRRYVKKRRRCRGRCRIGRPPTTIRATGPAASVVCGKTEGRHKLNKGRKG